MSRIYCLFGVHTRDIIEANNFLDISFGQRVKSFEVIYRCKVCGLIETKFFYGYTLNEKSRKILIDKILE